MKSTERAGVIRGRSTPKTGARGACKPAKFIRPIKKVFDQNISIEEKNIFFIVQSLMNKDIFKHLFTSFFW